MKMIKINSVVTLTDGRKGKVIARINDEEYILKSGKGGTITYFKKNDVESVEWD